MKAQEFLFRDSCRVCGQTPCNCTHVTETALAPGNVKTDTEARRRALQDLTAKRQALADLERQFGADQEAIRQRKLDLEKEARVKGLTEDEINENLRKWFKEKWVRFGPDGKIRGDCARGDDSEGKPKCLPQAKAHALGKKGRASAAARKRREDPNPERRGPAKNVATKKKSNEGVAEGVYPVSAFKVDAYESMSDFRKWMRSPKNNERGMTRHIVDIYENIIVNDDLLTESSQTFIKRKQQAKAFSDNFKQFDDSDKVQIKLGNKIALLSSTVIPDDKSSKIELSGFTTPKKIVKINLDNSGKIDSIKFDDGSIFPEASEFTTVGGVNITNTIFFPDSGSASKAYTAIWMYISNLEGKGWKIENYMSEGVAEGTKQQKDQDIEEQHQQCPECGGPMFPALILGEKQDACYYKVKSRYKVWPSAYASGALVQCRKKGAKNWGNKE